MLFWCIINVAVDYICTPSVLITATKILFWTLNYFIFFSEREKNFSQVIYLSFLGKSGHFTISKHYLTRFCWKNNYQRQRINVLFFFSWTLFCKVFLQDTSKEKSCLIVWLPFHDTQPLSVSYLTAIWEKVRYIMHLEP